MNYPASAPATKPNTPSLGSNPDLRRCQNVASGQVCRSTLDVRYVLLYPPQPLAQDPWPAWLCAVCESDLCAGGYVVARVLSRSYNPTAEQLNEMRRTMSEQAELWPTGF